jgi:hypothetical protein
LAFRAGGWKAIFTDPAEVVGWNGAVQAQDYPGAIWSLAQRLKRPSLAGIERAFDDGRILRTHIMRPTWHFVLPEDIRWMLALTAPRVNALSNLYYRKSGLDAPTVARSQKALATAMRGGRALTRAEMAAALKGAGVEAGGLRFTYLLMRAELDQVICSGPKRGKQFTYMLLDERAPAGKTLSRAEAVAELARRYFQSHGPATPHDFAWWSGLTLADARAGLERLGGALVKEEIAGRALWRGPVRRGVKHAPGSALLLSTYDEYTLSYADRGDMAAPGIAAQAKESLYWNMIVMDGLVVGSWRRTFSKGAVVIQTKHFTRLTAAHTRAIAESAQGFGEFLGMKVDLR